MGIRIRYFDKKKFIKGLLSVLLGICMPYFLTINTLGIPQQVYDSIVTGDQMLLWEAGMKLVALNAIRAFPHSIGAYMIAESIEVDSDYPIAQWLKSAIVCVIIPPVYYLISVIHRIKYDLGVPAFALILILIFLGKRDYNYVSLWKKNMLVMVLLTALQFLDVMPCMRHLPIGRGEMSRDVKLVAQFLNMEEAMDMTGLIFFSLLMSMGVLLFLLIRDENNLRAMNKLKELNEHLAMETKLRVLENRTYLELSHLVHDLKSPLTSAQALVGVVRMSSEEKGDQKTSDYLGRVEASIEKMSGMISEILYENHTSYISTDDILASVLAQISISEYSSLVYVHNQAPGVCIQVNKIRFSRALVNLLENSFYAISTVSGGEIRVSVEFSNVSGEPQICFSVRDNGKGIDSKTMEMMWDNGFSTRSSHGLGLSFVRKVVTASGGSIEVESHIDQGTEIRLMVPAEGNEVAEDEHAKEDEDTVY